jgi:hypothetical protein
LIKYLLTRGLSYQPYSFFVNLFGVDAHFKTHLCIGGFAGVLSITIATNDVIFWLFHQYDHIIKYKYHLSRDDLIVPEIYSLGIKFINDSQKVETSDIEKDNLKNFDNIPIREAFQSGFGGLCYIYDQLVLPINQMLKNEKTLEPVALQRLKTL